MVNTVIPTGVSVGEILNPGQRGAVLWVIKEKVHRAPTLGSAALCPGQRDLCCRYKGESEPSTSVHLALLPDCRDSANSSSYSPVPTPHCGDGLSTRLAFHKSLLLSILS